MQCIPRVTKRLSRGLSGELSDTWSTAICNSAAGNVNGTSDMTTSERDPGNKDLPKGLLIFHGAHVVKHTEDGTCRSVPTGCCWLSPDLS